MLAVVGESKNILTDVSPASVDGLYSPNDFVPHFIEDYEGQLALMYGRYGLSFIAGTICRPNHTVKVAVGQAEWPTNWLGRGALFGPHITGRASITGFDDPWRSFGLWIPNSDASERLLSSAQVL